jgi:peptidoglycan/LPS O-acetylase OafA/YrhL
MRATVTALPPQSTNTQKRLSEAYGEAMPQNARNRNFALDYLRAFVILLVVAFHSALAYSTTAPRPSASFSAEPSYWRAFPVVDAHRWVGFDIFTSFNDIFFMSLLFFISGIFVWHGLASKGALGFLKHRALRLGLPFLISIAVLTPLAYYPVYRLTGADPALSSFAKAWSSLSGWPSGPAWFLWVLLAFDCIAALAFVIAPRAMVWVGQLSGRLGRRPSLFYFALVTFSAALYAPMVHAFGAMAWFNFGVFTFQKSRILLYAFYFVAGLWAGIGGLGEGLLDATGRLARRWWLWGIAGILTFFGVIISSFTKSIAAQELLFVVSCAASSFFLLSLFLRFSKMSRVWNSLSRNAYGIYLVHYIFVVWLQYFLLRISLSAMTKGLIVFIGAVSVSWMTVALLRKLIGPNPTGIGATA